MTEFDVLIYKSTLTVYAFQEPLGFEAVIYGKNDHDDGYTFISTSGFSFQVAGDIIKTLL